MSVKMGTDVLVGRAILSSSAALMTLPATVFVATPEAATRAARPIARPAPSALVLRSAEDAAGDLPRRHARCSALGCARDLDAGAFLLPDLPGEGVATRRPV